MHTHVDRLKYLETDLALVLGLAEGALDGGSRTS